MPAQVPTPIKTFRDLLARLAPGRPPSHHPHAGYHHPSGTGGDAIAARHHGPIAEKRKRVSRGL